MLVGPEGGSQLIGCSIVVQFAEDRAPQREAEIAEDDFCGQAECHRGSEEPTRRDLTASKAGRAALTHLLIDDELRMNFDL